MALFVVSSAFALSVQQRHREIALLRAIGATPRQVRRLIALEALVIAVVGTLLAMLVGIGLAHVERRVFIHVGIVAPDFRLVVGWIPPLVGLAAAVVTTELASLLSGRRAARVRPVDALREARVEGQSISRARGLVGLAAVAVGIVVFVEATRNVSSGGGDDAPAAGLVWMLAATLLGPLIAIPFVQLIGRPLRALSPGSGLLAHANCRSNLKHLTAVATPLMLAVSLACALLIARTTDERVAREQATDRTIANHVLVRPGGRLMPRVAKEVRAVPGVGQAAALVSTSAVVPTGGGHVTFVPAQAVEVAGLDGVVDLGVAGGSLSDLHGDTVAVGTRLARQLGWAVGDRVRLWLGDGTPVRLRVVALFRRPLGFGQVVVPVGLAEQHVSDPRADAILVSDAAGGRPGEVRAGLERLARAYPGAEVLDRDAYLERIDSEARRESLAVYALLGIVVLFSAVAAVNALGVAVSARARDLELLRLIGATRAQLTWMIRFEVLVTVTFATVVGAVTAAPGAIAFTYGQTGSVVPTVPAWLWLGLPLTAALLGSVAIALPLRGALRASRGSVTTAAG